MHYHNPIIAFVFALALLLHTPAHAGNVIDPYTLFPPGGSTAFVSVGTGYETFSVGATFIVDLPDGLVNGNWLILVVNSKTGTPSATGWTSVGTLPQGYAYGRLTVLKRQVDGTEGATVTVTAGVTAEPVTAVAVQFSAGTGVGASDFYTSGSGTSSTPDTPSLTFTGGSGIVLSFAGYRDSIPSNIVWSPDPPTTIFEAAGYSSQYGMPLAVSYAPHSGGSGGSVTFTYGNSDYWLAGAVEIY